MWFHFYGYGAEYYVYCLNGIFAVVNFRASLQMPVRSGHIFYLGFKNDYRPGRVLLVR